MGSDCTVEIDEGYINIRVGAIIMKDDKFLMVGNENYDYLYSVGGRIKFGETAEDMELKCNSVTDENFEEKLIWVSPDSEITYYPEFFRTELVNPQLYPKHLVTDGRRKYYIC